MHNEPGNSPFIVEAFASALKMSNEQIRTVLYENALTFYGLNKTPSVSQQLPTQTPSNLTEEIQKSEKCEEHNEQTTPQEESPVDEPQQPKKKQQQRKQKRNATHKEEEKDDEEKAASSAEEDTSESSEENPQILYACKMCRRELFSPSDVLPHAAGEHAPLAQGRKRGEACTMVFVKPLKWMEDAAKQQGGLEGKIPCFGCGAKLGRFSSTNALLPCSCGKTAPLFPNASVSFRIVRARVDLLLPSTKAAERDNEDDEFETQPVAAGKSRKARKKQQKAKHSGNFSQFRNKAT